MDIITNNVDRGEYKIRVHEGIILRDINEKKHEEKKRGYAIKNGIVPFYYITKDGHRVQSNACVKGPFLLSKQVNPGTGAWCATKIDDAGNMIEWGYCIDQARVIPDIDIAMSVTKQLIKLEKPESYIRGYLRTHVMDLALRTQLFSSPEFLELLRDKNILPDPSSYKIGDTITVKDITYIIQDSLELGKGWTSVKPVIIPKSPIIQKPIIQGDQKQYATNRDPKDQKIKALPLNKTYPGIIGRNENGGRGDNRKELQKECIQQFDYMNAANKRVSATATCEKKNPLGTGDDVKNWCATEVDQTGLMKEWGFCMPKGVHPEVIAKTEKTIWTYLCEAIQYENWTNVSRYSKELLHQGQTEHSIYNRLIQTCDRNRINPYYEIFKTILTKESIKLYPWSINLLEPVQMEYLQAKISLSIIVHKKLTLLDRDSKYRFTIGIQGKDDIWYVYYYFIVERLFMLSILSETLQFDTAQLEYIKRTNNLQELDHTIYRLENQIKEVLRPYFSEESDDFLLNPNSISTNYPTLLSTSHIREERIIQYMIFDQTNSIPLAIQMMFYNKSFVEPKQDVEEIIEVPISPMVKKNSSDSEWDDEERVFYSHYPELTDPHFYTRLHRKKEFQINKMTSWKDKKIEELCRQDVFDLSPQQQWVSNFFNTETPYKGLLLYWGTGVGKTCASITIAQKHLEYYKKYNRKILVILGTSTMQNYIKELYNFNKEKLEIKKRLLPGSLQCTADRYYQPILSSDPESMKKRENRILKKIEQDYEFITYGSLKGIIKKLLNRRGLQLELDEQRKSVPAKVPQVEGEEVKSGTVIYRAVRSFKGFIWKPVEVKDPQREERIRVALSEYFSNRLIIIDEIQNIRTASDGGDQIAPKMLEMIVHYSSDLKLVMMSATPMFNNSTEIVYILNLLLENDKREKVKVNELFDGKNNLIDSDRLLAISKGYISYVRGANPVSFPKKLLPNQSPIPAIVESNELYQPSPVHKMNGMLLEDSEKVRYNPLIRCDMSPYQEEIFKRAVLGNAEENSNELDDVVNETFDINGKMISNIVYPLPPGQTLDTTDISILYGEKGFDRCFTERKHNQYEYNLEQVTVPILDVAHLAQFSPKMDKILNNIMNTEKGIIFVYCEYKKGGSLPFALMLEQNGFEHLSIEGKIGEPIPKPKLFSRWKKNSLPQKWKYVLLDGDMDPKKRAQIIQRCNSEQNKEGESIKVIIGTRVAAEGVDFSRIRQIHIFNPWDNFSRIDQTIGRGIRNCSHKDLPAEDRNVTVFLYASHMKDNSVETTDEKIHRRAERKDIQMKHVEFILRNTAVDCLSNFVANQYLIEDFGEAIGDKDGTRECGYQNCKTVYQCVDYDKIQSDMKNSDMDKDTYDIPSHATRELERYKTVIKIMFTKSVIFQLKHIKMVCEMKIIPFEESIFLIAMDEMIRKDEKLYDKYHRIGRMIYKDGYYMFQPYDLDQTGELPEYNRETPLLIKPQKAEITIRQKTISQGYVDKWYAQILGLIRNTDDPYELAYILDRVKDVVMKRFILDWFNEFYYPLPANKSIQDKLTEYFENKDLIIQNQKEQPIAMQWTRELSYEYLLDKRELVEHMNVDRFQKEMIIYNFDEYVNLKNHVIGRLEEVSNGKEEDAFKTMTCKIIDFSFAENKSNIKLDGKSCMSYNRTPMNKIMDNIELDVHKDIRREDQCKQIELQLRKLNNEHELDKVWWIESNRLYKLDKLL